VSDETMLEVIQVPDIESGALLVIDEHKARLRPLPL
jgi:hypothetical protein